MRVLFLVAGTHGDVVPVAALGRGLAARGHAVRVATGVEHRFAVEAAGLAWFPLSPSYRDGIAASRDALGGSEAAGARVLARALRAAADAWPEELRAAGSDAELAIGAGTLMGAVASAFGEARGVPVAHLHVMPLLPTRNYPPSLPAPGSMPWARLRRRMLPGPANLALFRAVRTGVWRACFADAVGAYRRALGLPALPWRGPAPAAAPTLCCISPRLLPPPGDWPRDRVAVTGAWAARARDGDLEPPNPAIERFLAAGPAPVYVGFGSMEVAPERRRALARTVAEALAIAGVRALVARDWMPDGARDEAGGRVLAVGHVPFDLLFGRIAAAVHHGGAGTVHAAARAGIGQVVVPFVIDQFFWSWQLVGLGVSPACLTRGSLTAPALARAIRDACSPATRARASALAARMAGEDGVVVAIAQLEGWGLLRAASPS